MGAENGNSYAQTNLGHLYSQGLGVEKSDEEAFGWYLKAAEQGREVAQDNIGHMYEFGLGVEQSYEQAARWYAKAANKGETLAMLHLGRLFEAGLGVPQSIENAKIWYSKAAYNDVEEGKEAMLRLDSEWEEEEPRFVEDCYDDYEEDEEDPPFISGWTLLDPPEEFSGSLDPDTEREIFDEVTPRFDPSCERYSHQFLCEFVRCLLNYAYRPFCKDMPEIDLGKTYETVSRRLSGRMKVGKSFRGFYYSDCITIEMDDSLFLSLNRNVQEQLEVWVDEAPRDSDCIPDRYCSVTESDLDSFCDLLEYIQDNLGRWRSMIEERANRRGPALRLCRPLRSADMSFVSHPRIIPDRIEKGRYQTTMAQDVSDATPLSSSDSPRKKVIVLKVATGFLEGRKILMLVPTESLVNQRSRFFSEMLSGTARLPCAS